MALVQALAESSGGYTPLLKKGQKEAVWPSKASSRLGSRVIGLLQRYVEDQYDYWARCKRAAILADWISGISRQSIEREYSATPFQGKIGHGDIQRFADATRFHLRAAFHIAAALFPEYGAQGEQVDILIKRLEVGLPTDALTLLELPVSLERGEYLALYQRGVKTVAEVWRLSREDLARSVGRAKAAVLEPKRPPERGQHRVNGGSRHTFEA